MIRSSHNCFFDFRALDVLGSGWLASPAELKGDGPGSDTWLAWTPLSLCKLAVLLPSSSVNVVSAILGGPVASPLVVLRMFLMLFSC